MFKDFIKNNKKEIIITLLIFIIMLLLNCLTPIISDDFGYSFNLEHERLRGLKDIANFQIVHYKWWGGRVIAHSLAQFFLWLPKSIFNIANSLCFTIMIILMYLITKKDKKSSQVTIWLLFLLTYFLQPVLGQCSLWLTGSCNYLWTTTIILFLLFLFVKERKIRDNIIYIIVMFFLGIIAGLTNENTSFGLITMLILIIIKQIKEKEKIKKWQITAVIGNIIGFLILILAPGNYIRKDGYTEETTLIIRLIKRFIEYTKTSLSYQIIIFLIFSFLIISIIRKKKKINLYSIILMIGSIFCIYSMLLSPTFPERSWFGIITLSIMSTIMLLNDYSKINPNIKKYILIITIVLTIFFIPNYINLYKDTYNLRNVWNKRINYIKEHPNQEEYSFKVYKSNNKKNPSYKQTDLVEDPNAWPNKDISNYYNIKSIKGK